MRFPVPEWTVCLGPGSCAETQLDRNRVLKELEARNSSSAQTYRLVYTHAEGTMPGNSVQTGRLQRHQLKVKTIGAKPGGGHGLWGRREAWGGLVLWRDVRECRISIGIPSFFKILLKYIWSIVSSYFNTAVEFFLSLTFPR